MDDTAYASNNQAKALTWLEILHFHAEEGAVSKAIMDDLLTDCLSTPGWFDINVDPTLYEFLAQYWNDTRWQSRIRMALDNTMLSKSTKDSFYDCIESYFPKKQRKAREKTASGVDSAESDDRPIIVADFSDTTKVVDECIQAIMDADEPIFQRDGVISIITKSKRKSLYGSDSDMVRLKIAEAGVEHLQEVATRCAIWMVGPSATSDTENFKPAGCPKKVIATLKDRPEYPFPILTGISTTPMLRHDGSIITTTGYDPQTGIYYQPAHEYPEIPENPSRDDALDALQILLEPFIDFQFDKDYHKAAAVSAILSIHCRHLCRTVPLYAVSSNTRGAGKGLLVNVFSLAATGQEPAKTGATKDDEEMRKTMLAIAMDGDRITVFDNIPEGPFGTPSLERAITEPVVRERILGTNRNAEVSLQTVFFATANNLSYSGDMARRVLPIVLAPTMENPEERTNFTIDNLLGWTMENHPRLAAAALTILKAYILAGSPRQDLSQYGSFEQWSDLVRSIVVWCGMEDPCKGRASIEVETDAGYQDLQTLITSWKAAFPPPVRQTLKRIVDMAIDEVDKKARQQANRRSRDNHPYDDAEPEPDENLIGLGEALLAFDPRCNSKLSELSPLRLAKRLPVNSGSSRVIDGYRLRKEINPHSKVNEFWIEEVGSNGIVHDDELPF